MRVYLDMDGVLADFDKGLKDGHGIVNCRINYATPWEHKSSEQRKLAHDVIKAMEVPGFFENLPMMEGAEKLWLQAGTPSILTALPNLSCDARVAREKRNWVDSNIGQISSDRFITCLKSQKSHYAMDHVGGPCQEFGIYDEPNILVDDDYTNCDRWQKAGGIAIYFETMDQAVNDLKKAMNG